jgi:nucleoid DNA-binding protein
MPSDLNRQSLVRRMADQVDGLTVPMAAAALEALLESITDTLVAGGTVRLAGFGEFSRSYRKPRVTRHPRTQQPIAIPEAYVPRFTCGPKLRQRVQQGGNHPSDPVNRSSPPRGNQAKL